MISEGEIDGRLVAATHHGWVSPDTWPPGDYWIVEVMTNRGTRFYWADTKFSEKSSAGGSWQMTPQLASGFSTFAEADAAFAVRGAPFSSEVEDGVMITEHQWEA